MPSRMKKYAVSEVLCFLRGGGEFHGTGRGINYRRRAIINVMIFEIYFMQIRVGSMTCIKNF